MNFLFRNLGLKLLALFSAVIFWILLIGLQNSFHSLKDPLEVKGINLGEEYALDGSLGDVSVKVNAQQSRFQKLGSGDFTAFVDLDGLTEGTYMLPVQVRTELIDVGIVKIEPSELQVKIDPITEKQLPVQIKVVGTLAAGNEIKSLEAEYTSLTAKGSSNDLLRAEAVQLIVNVDNVEGSFSVVAKPVAIDELATEITQIKFDVEDVRVDVKIDESVITKTVFVDTEIVGKLDGSKIKSVQIVPDKIVIQGTAEDLAAIERLTTEPVDITKFTQGKTVSSKVILPDGVSLKANEPETVIINAILEDL